MQNCAREFDILQCLKSVYTTLMFNIITRKFVINSYVLTLGNIGNAKGMI